VPARTSAHAIADDRNGPLADLLKQLEIGGSIADDQLARQPDDERHDHLEVRLALGLVLKVRDWEQGSAAGAVEDVGREHHETTGRDAVGHLLDLAAQPERVHDQQDGGMALAVIGLRQVRVRYSVLRLDLDCVATHRSAPLCR
jgi:hypothetical protein